MLCYLNSFQNLFKILFFVSAGDRSDAEDVVIIITDDNSHGRFQEHLYENRLHQISGDIITIGIGYRVNTGELQNIATDYGHTFNVHYASGLSAIESKVAQLICPSLAGNVIP